jgi:hypothetical protein
MPPYLDQDLSGVDENDAGGSWRALPDGEYIARVVKSDYKQTRSKNGMVLKLEIKTSTPKEGTFFENLTLQHPNADTVRIAKAKLKALAVACRHPNPDRIEQSEELHDISFTVVLKRVADKDFGDSDGFANRVMSYRPMGAPASTRQTAQPKPKDDVPF